MPPDNIAKRTPDATALAGILVCLSPLALYCLIATFAGLCGGLVAGAVVAVSATSPTTAPQTLAEMKTQEAQSLDQTLLRLPSAGEHAIRDVLDLKIVNGFLQAQTHLNLFSAALQRVKIRGLATDAMIRTSADNTLTYFSHHDFTPPDMIDSAVEIVCSPRSLIFAYSEEHENWSQTYELTQSIDPPSVTLRVQVINENDDGSPPPVQTGKIKFTALSLEDLKRNHLPEVQKYVRPMFRALGEEASLFGSDASIAWQVLREYWKPQPATHEKVLQLVGQLNSQKYRDREAADHELRAMGLEAVMDLIAGDRTGWSPEQSTRVDAIIGQYQSLSSQEIEKYSKDLDFLIDCLDSDDANLRAAALARLTMMMKHPVTFDPGPTRETREAAVEALHSQLSNPPEH